MQPPSILVKSIKNEYARFPRIPCIQISPSPQFPHPHIYLPNMHHCPRIAGTQNLRRRHMEIA
jgi:hypothetical protein